MKVMYDETADALYVQVVAGMSVARTEQLDVGTLVDLADDGSLVGIEVIRPARSWVEVVTNSYGLPEEARRFLVSMWGAHTRYPFSRTRAAVAG